MNGKSWLGVPGSCSDDLKSKSGPADQNLKWLRLSIIAFVLVVAGAVTEAQQRAKIPRVGILFMGGRDQPHLEEFKQGLREHGYSEGKNIILEYRYAEGRYDRLPDLAQEFVREKVDVIVTTSSISAQAARKATRTIPIVMTSGSPVEQGLAESLARPGGNVTGLSVLVSDLSGKRVELLKESFPKLSRVAALWSPRASESVIGLKETQEAARGLSVPLYSMEVQTANDLDKAFANCRKQKSTLCSLSRVLWPRSIQNKSSTSRSSIVCRACIRRANSPRKADPSLMVHSSATSIIALPCTSTRS